MIRRKLSDYVKDIETPRWALPLLAPRRWKGAWGGRGSGKSHFFVEKLLFDSIMLLGLRSVCLREVQKDLKHSVKQLIEDKIESMGWGGFFEVQEYMIRSPGGGHIIFQGMQNYNSDSIKSLEGYNRALVEEGQAFSQRSFDLLYPTIRAPEAELWFAWNPISPKDAVDKFFQENRNDPDVISVRTNWMDNPWWKYNPGLIKDMERDRRRNVEKYNHIWMGEYQVRSEARVFRNIFCEDFETPEDARFLHGGDWGFANDPSVALRGFEGDDGCLYIDAEAYEIGCRIEHLPFLFAGFADYELNAKNREARPSALIQEWANNGRYEGIPSIAEWPCIVDSARPETIDYMKRHGFDKIRPAIKGPGSVEDGIEFLQNYEAIYIHPRCPRTWDEFRTYSWKIDKKTEEVLPKLSDSDNHFIDSARYMVETLRRSTLQTAVTGTYTRTGYRRM